jgi:hypothetical protein
MRLASFQAHVLAQRTYAGLPAPLSGEAIGKIIAQSRRGELRLARGFRECRGLPPKQLEDIYQAAKST